MSGPVRRDWNRPGYDVPTHGGYPDHRPAPRFPTMLRKMWTGREVQAWIDEHWPDGVKGGHDAQG
jgi:hypothetical protein